MARVAVDVGVGRQGVRILQAAGHVVVVEAQPAESDRDWFERAVERAVECVISADKDLAILCYDHRVKFFRARARHRGIITAERFIQWYAARGARGCVP